MAAGFKVRRVKSEQSIGDKLKRSRIRKKISVAEVEEATKIRAKFILALESDSWEQIPSEVYGRGYLERYLQFLQLPGDTVIKQYDRERALYARNCQDAQVELAPKAQLQIPRFLLTPRFFVLSFVIVGLIGFGGLLTSQIQRFSAAPFLELASPVQAKNEAPASELVVSVNTLTVSGRTAVGANVDVNGQVAEVNDDGTFTGTVALQPGVNAVVVKAVNPKGKETVQTLSVMVK